MRDFVAVSRLRPRHGAAGRGRGAGTVRGTAAGPSGGLRVPGTVRGTAAGAAGEGTAGGARTADRARGRRVDDRGRWRRPCGADGGAGTAAGADGGAGTAAGAGSAGAGSRGPAGAVHRRGRGVSRPPRAWSPGNRGTSARGGTVMPSGRSARVAS
ncbi:hypothetical protein GCM10009602_30510 [Nocardiopsis tropica]